MKKQNKKPTPTEILKAENAALRLDLWKLTMSKSFIEIAEVSDKWRMRFQTEDMIMSGTHTKITEKGSKNKISGLKIVSPK